MTRGKYHKWNRYQWPLGKNRQWSHTSTMSSIDDTLEVDGVDSCNWRTRCLVSGSNVRIVCPYSYFRIVCNVCIKYLINENVVPHVQSAVIIRGPSQNLLQLRLGSIEMLRKFDPAFMTARANLII